MRVLGVITARGGSKGIPRKNLRELAGKPLLQYTAEAALASRLMNEVLLSTEDEELAQLGRRCGLQVPFVRPTQLAGDNIPSLPVVQHAVGWMEDQGYVYDAICLLQPTTPMRRANLIDECIELLQRQRADSVVTVLPVPEKYNPHWVFFSPSDGFLRLSTGALNPIARRQDLPAAFHRDGSVYVTRRDVLMLQNSLFGTRVCGYELRPEESVNIDTFSDWQRAEELLRSHTRVDAGKPIGAWNDE